MSEQTQFDDTPSGNDGTNAQQQNHNNDHNNQQQRQRNNSRNNFCRGGNNNFDQAMKNFRGSTEDIAATLSLPNERVSSDRGFDHFAEELELYVLKEFTNGRDVVTIITDLVDPTQAFINNMPAPVFDAAQVQANPMMSMVNEQMAKQFAISINTLKTNITKIYSLVWGQCTPGLQAEIKSEHEYNQRAAVYDTLWLLQAVKRISSGVVTRGNGYSNMLTIMTNFI